MLLGWQLNDDAQPSILSDRLLKWQQDLGLSDGISVLFRAADQ